MAVPPYSHVYMETMEEAENKEEESSKTWRAGGTCTHGGEQSKRLLVCYPNGSGQHGDDKRKTDTSRLL